VTHTRRPAIARARRVVLLAAAAAGAGACANVLGVADYKDAVDELCGPCDTIPDCADRLDASLSAAPREEVIAWLEEYKRLACNSSDCQLELARCFYTAPDLCTALGDPCETSEACCGFDFDEPAKAAACCAGSGSGVCCDDCLSCADRIDAYADGKAVGDATLCRTHVKSWQDLLACATDGVLDNCKAECEGAMPTPMFCKGCLADKCQATFKACGEDPGF
jgi:hypothetical protein